VFQLFVINPRRTDAVPVSTALKKNKVKLCHFVKDLTLALDGGEPDLEDEKRQVIEGLK
jgi:hypothetical protein